MNRAKIVLDYLKMEIKIINNTLKNHKGDRVNLIKDLIVLKKSYQILERRVRL